MYLFLSTRQPGLSERAHQPVGLKVVRHTSLGDRQVLFLHDQEADEAFNWSVINDHGDICRDDVRLRPLHHAGGPPSRDSLVSFAALADEHFVARTDFWGIQHHYWHHDPDTFACSDSVFTIARLLGLSFSRPAVFEYLFFRAPVGRNTWFEDVSLLVPGQSITYDLARHTFTLDGAHDAYDTLTEACGQENPAEGFAAFFRQCSNTIKPRSALISLSAGVDSRTVLAGLVHFDLLARAVCFGRPDFIETRAICDLTHQLGIPLQVLDFDSLLADWEGKFLRASFLTNGMLQPLRVHYAGYYDCLEGAALFEGILGSEFVKGEIAIDVMTGKSHARAIMTGTTVHEAVDLVFGFLPPGFRAEMSDYVADVYGHMLQPLTTQEGRRRYAAFLLSFVPSKVFTAPILLASQRMKVYYPFLSARMLAALFRSGGVVKGSSLEASFPGPIQRIRHEAEMVRPLSDKIYRSVLDRGTSLREALEYPSALATWRRRCRLAIARLRYRGLHDGQVDHNRLSEPMLDFVARADSHFFQEHFDTSLPHTRLAREQAKLACLSQFASSRAVWVRRVSAAGAPGAGTDPPRSRVRA